MLFKIKWSVKSQAETEEVRKWLCSPGGGGLASAKALPEAGLHLVCWRRPMWVERSEWGESRKE